MAGKCPQCSADVPRPEGADGLWTGVNDNGTRAAGGMYMATCSVCSTKLVAYDSLYDNSGNRRPAGEVRDLDWLVDKWH